MNHTQIFARALHYLQDDACVEDPRPVGDRRTFGLAQNESQIPARHEQHAVGRQYPPKNEYPDDETLWYLKIFLDTNRRNYTPRNVLWALPIHCPRCEPALAIQIAGRLGWKCPVRLTRDQWARILSEFPYVYCIFKKVNTLECCFFFKNDANFVQNNVFYFLYHMLKSYAQGRAKGARPSKPIPVSKLRHLKSCIPKGRIPKEFWTRTTLYLAKSSSR
jgi:hypothetical protein